MSLISKLKTAPRNLPSGTVHGKHSGHLVGLLVDKGERYGGSFLLGYLKAKYREQFSFKGVAGDTLVGVAGLVLGAGLNIYSGGRSAWAEHFERIGDVGLQAHMLQWGADVGADHAGYSTKVVSAAPAGARRVPAATVVGAIPAAKGGTVYLTDQDILSALNKRA